MLKTFMPNKNWYPTVEFIQGLLDEKKNAPLLTEKDRLESRRRLRAGTKKALSPTKKRP